MFDVRNRVKASALRVLRLRREPVVVQTLRSTAAATISFIVAERLSSEAAPLTAPLTALLVTQVTLFSTIRLSLTRVNAVVTGVLVAIGFSALVGLAWWSLALIILMALVVGRIVRAGDFVVEVAISAMLVLGVTQVQVESTAWTRVLDTLIGAGVGLLFNFLFIPPVWVETAGESIEALARRIRRLMLHISDGLADPTTVETAAARLHEARRIDQEITDVDAELRQAEESLRLNPRVREGLLHRVVLRTGLDTLEICAVVVRVLARTLTDLAKARVEEPMFPPRTGAAMENVIARMGDAIVSFAVLVTSPVSANAERAETRLAEDLDEARGEREHVAQLLLDMVRDHPAEWQLHGALLTQMDRILDELDLENRSIRLMEELDNSTRRQREKYRWLRDWRARLGDGARRARDVPRPRRGGDRGGKGNRS
ncbi:FUSC family protein [Streptomyces sp. NRRL F-5126]|uniref:FUSC family protein n=1 Tax=Streptomyces sp. NRRL F-5126 TaxID=1463857 RepID=UPI00068A5DF3|nr:FUSC family protein [Streptomyces sp. NRRL F-5126]